MLRIARSLFSKPTATTGAHPADAAVKLHKLAHSELTLNASGLFVLPNPDRIVLSQAKHPKNSRLAQQQTRFNTALLRVKELHTAGSSRQQRAVAADVRYNELRERGSAIDEGNVFARRQLEVECGRSKRLFHSLNAEIEKLLVKQRSALDELYAAKIEYTQALESRGLLDYRARLSLAGRHKSSQVAPASTEPHIVSIDELPLPDALIRSVIISRRPKSSRAATSQPLTSERSSSEDSESSATRTPTKSVTFDSALELQKLATNVPAPAVAPEPVITNFQKTRNFWLDRERVRIPVDTSLC